MAVYDAEVEWIEFKAGAYVNTGIYPTSLDLDIWYLADDYVSFGWMYNTKANNTWIGAIKNTIWWKNHNSKKKLTGTSYGVKRFKMNEGFFDGGILRQAFTTSLGNSQIASIPLYIGGVYDANVSAMSTTATDYSGKPKRIAIYQGSTLVRDFIPVRVGQVGYLYDKVSDTLFGSDGTENFTIGADRVKTSEFTKANLIDFRRRMLIPVLPYDAEVEYLESTSTQWIDLGIYGNSYLEYEIKITFSTDGEWCYYFGAQTSDSSNRFSLMSGTKSRLYCNNGTITNERNFTVSTGSPFVVKKINNDVYLNGTKEVSFTNTTYTTPRTIFLFACNAEDVITPKKPISGAKVYYFKIGNLDLIPVRIGTTGYMYDKVSGTLFGNAGTGSFILGADVLRG